MHVCTAHACMYSVTMLPHTYRHSQRCTLHCTGLEITPQLYHSHQELARFVDARSCPCVGQLEQRASATACHVYEATNTARKCVNQSQRKLGGDVARTNAATTNNAYERTHRQRQISTTKSHSLMQLGRCALITGGTCGGLLQSG